MGAATTQYWMTRFAEYNQALQGNIEELPHVTRDLQKTSAQIEMVLGAMRAEAASLEQQAEQASRSVAAWMRLCEERVKLSSTIDAWFKSADGGFLAMRREARRYVAALVSLRPFARAQRLLSATPLRLKQAPVRNAVRASVRSIQALGAGVPATYIDRFQQEVLGTAAQAARDAAQMGVPLPDERVTPIGSAELGYEPDELGGAHADAALMVSVLDRYEGGVK